MATWRKVQRSNLGLLSMSWFCCCSVLWQRLLWCSGHDGWEKYECCCGSSESLATLCNQWGGMKLNSMYIFYACACTVGDHRCQTRQYGQCLPHHCALLVGKVCTCAWDIHPVFIFPFLSTNKIVAISTVSRTDHGVAQTREFQCTKIAVPQAIARGN